jgi:serine/threonine protein kinase
MTLTQGTRLGPDEILASVGAGGMGEIFTARDTRLERTVAVKVPPSHLSPPGEETSPPIALVQNWTVLMRQAK